MAPPAKNHNHLATYHLCFLLVLSVAALSSVVSATDSSLCTIPSPAPEHVAAGNDKLPLIYSFRLSAGYFSGGEDIHFARDESGGDDDGSFLHARRSFTLLPLRVDRTTDATVVHVSATLRLSGGRALHAVAAHRRRDRFAGGAHSVSFHLDGYYSSTSAELCMIGSGTYAEGDDWLEHLPGVVLRLRVPSPPSLSDPFVTGQLKGAGFDAITLVAYAEGDLYKYGQHASCPPPPSTARGALQALGVSFSCAHLKEQLVSSYKLQYGGGGGAHASSTSPAPLRLQEPRMHVGQVQCTPDGAVRVYATFSSSTNMFFAGQLRPGFMVKEVAVVAEGRWDSALSTLCLRACRVVRSGPAALAVQEQDCGIGMSFWFPSVWTVRDRSIVAGTLWNASHETDGSSAAAAAGAISASSIDFDASSIDFDSNRGNFSDVEYRYTMVDEAKQRYFADVLRSHRNKTKGRFPAATYSYRDFEFRFYMDKGNGGSGYGHGEADPVTIGSAMVYGDRLAAADSFSRHAEVDMELELLTVSYNIHIRRVPPDLNPMRLNLTSPVAIEERVVTAEGVYDPRTGVLCMIGCQELAGGSMDCRTLITVQFASLDAKAQGHGRGVISSLRPKADPLFFDKMDIVLFGMYAEQVAESVSRMDMESVMLVVSMTLPCLFTVGIMGLAHLF